MRYPRSDREHTTTYSLDALRAKAKAGQQDALPFAHTPASFPQDSNVLDVQNDFTAWAKVAAHLFQLPDADRMRVLEEFGLTQVWSSADVHWCGQLNQEIASGQRGRADKYLEMCAAELRRRHRAASAYEALLELPTGRNVRQMLWTVVSAIDWPVEYYAQLCSELERPSLRVQDTIEKFNLGNEHWFALVKRGWEERFEEHEQLRQHWATLKQRYDNAERS